MSHLFGPVPSRRLGQSLGVDLLPSKTCSFDCIYCEAGPTRHQTDTRLNYAAEAIIAEVAAFLEGNDQELDFITLAGRGEPTLNLGLGRIIRGIKALTSTAVAVLTNGSLLCRPEVRDEIQAADLILPSLDAVREAAFLAINRPLRRYSVGQLLEGLQALRREYPGRIWLEVMLLKGLNDAEEDLEPLRRALRRLAPDKVQLNTAVRPGVKDYAQPLGPDKLAAIAAYLEGEVEVISSPGGVPKAAATLDDSVLVEMLARRPMTAAQLAEGLGLDPARVQERLRRLEEAGRISPNLHQDQVFYRQQAS